MASTDENMRRIIWKHVRTIQTCMMTTLDGNAMRSRPMTGIARPEQGAIWFFTDKNAHKDEEVRANPTACLAYADTRDRTFVSISGTLSRVESRDTIHDLWSEPVSLYFPAGPDDPDIVLLKFRPETAEYWDSPSSAIVMAIKFIEAKMTGERPDLGENASVKLS